MISSEPVQNALSELSRQYLIESYFITQSVGDYSIGKHLKKVIRYLSNHMQWEEFKEEAKEHGDS